MFVLFGSVLKDLQAALSLNLVVLGVGPELGELLDNDVSHDLIATFGAGLNVFTFNFIPFLHPS